MKWIYKVKSKGILYLMVIVVILWALSTFLALQNPDDNRFNTAANIAVAAATLVLALVAFYQIREAREQARQQQLASLRPLLIPRTSLYQFVIPPTRLWHEIEGALGIAVQNVGSGVATNVWGVILPPVKPTYDTSLQLSMRSNLPIASGESALVNFTRGGTLFTPDERIENVLLGVPSERAPEASLPNTLDRRDRCVARLTLSYTDVFGLKHASIFDLTTTGVWVCVDILNNIARDLGDMDRAKSM